MMQIYFCASLNKLAESYLQIWPFCPQGELHDGMDILEYLMTRPSVMPRLNARVLTIQSKFLDFTRDGGKLHHWSFPHGKQKRFYAP